MVQKISPDRRVLGFFLFKGLVHISGSGIVIFGMQICHPRPEDIGVENADPAFPQSLFGKTHRLLIIRRGQLLNIGNSIDIPVGSASTARITGTGNQDCQGSQNN